MKIWSSISSGFSDISSTSISFDDETIDEIVESPELLSYSGYSSPVSTTNFRRFFIYLDCILLRFPFNS